MSRDYLKVSLFLVFSQSGENSFRGETAKALQPKAESSIKNLRVESSREAETDGQTLM